MSLIIILIFVVSFYYNSADDVSTRSTLFRDITTINVQEVAEKVNNEADPNKRLKMIQEILKAKNDEAKEKVIAQKEVYAVRCSTRFQNEVWYLENTFMVANFINRRKYIIRIRQQLLDNYFDALYLSEETEFTELRNLYYSLPEKTKEEIREKFTEDVKNIYSTVREFRWTLFVTWLTTTDDWLKEDIAPILCPLRDALNSTLELGFTIDDFIYCVFYEFSDATDILKSDLDTSVLVNRSEARETLKELYEEFFLFSKLGDPVDNERLRNRMFLAHYCAELLETTIWNNENIERNALVSPKTPLEEDPAEWRLKSYPDAVLAFNIYFEKKNKNFGQKT